MTLEKVEYLIVGAGPAGIQLAYFLERSKRDYLVLESAGEAGHFFTTFPRHRQLISTNKVFTGSEDLDFNLRHDWNSLLSNSNDIMPLMKEYSREYFPPADHYVRYLHDFSTSANLRIQYNTKVVSIVRDDETEEFSIKANDRRTYVAQRVIICSGVSKPYIPDIPGIELAENYNSMPVNPQVFENKNILIIGKGNSAFETADSLMASTALVHLVSPSPVKFAWKTHFVGHLRAVNNNFLDTYQLKSQNAVLDATVDKIEKDAEKFKVHFSYLHANEYESIYYDKVLVCTGFKFDASIFDENCKPNLTINNRFPQLTPEWESTNIPRLYFGGTITQSLDYKKSTSGFVHGFRYSVRSLHRFLEKRYHENSWPALELSIDHTEIASAIIKRVNRTSALWQQFGFLCDLIVINPAKGTTSYYEEMPEAYVHTSSEVGGLIYFTLTLEYGDSEVADPFNSPRVNDCDKADRSQFLHPIIRQYQNGHLESVHHLLEDLMADWTKDDHILPLKKYLKNILLTNMNVEAEMMSTQ